MEAARHFSRGEMDRCECGWSHDRTRGMFRKVDPRITHNSWVMGPDLQDLKRPEKCLRLEKKTFTESSIQKWQNQINKCFIKLLYKYSYTWVGPSTRVQLIKWLRQCLWNGTWRQFNPSDRRRGWGYRNQCSGPRSRYRFKMVTCECPMTRQGSTEKYGLPGHTSPVGTCLTIVAVSVTSHWGRRAIASMWVMVPGARNSGEGHRPLSSHDKETTQKRHEIGLPRSCIYNNKKTLEYGGEGGRTYLCATH